MSSDLVLSSISTFSIDCLNQSNGVSLMKIDLTSSNSTIDPSVANAIQPATISYTGKVRQEKSPTIVEVQMPLKQMKSGKAPGNDEITADLLKAGRMPVLK